MIMTKTPLRISFAGGGSDMEYYYKDAPGMVVSTAIDKYIYIAINPKFDNKIRASYSKTEIVDNVGDLQHELIRECLNLADIKGGIEIVSIADVPSGGTGLGSSSAYVVGLLNGLLSLQKEQLANAACRVEINRLKKPIGKQDQYIAAYGGFQTFRFYSDGTVDVDKVECLPVVQKDLENRLMLFYTGVNRESKKILAVQKKEFNGDTRLILRKMTGVAKDMRTAIKGARLDFFGELLDINWQLKKKLTGNISNLMIDEWYRRAKVAGAIGGKICGAGGGGFMLFYAPPEKHVAIKRALMLEPIKFSFEPSGSEVIYNK